MFPNVRTFCLAAALSLAPYVALDAARAQTCSQDDIGKLVDDTGQRLRARASEGEQRLGERMKRIASERGWSAADAETKVMALLTDEQTLELDERASALLTRLDRLSEDNGADASACRRLADAKIASSQLLEVTAERAARISAKLDLALKDSAGASASVTAQPTQPVPTPSPPQPTSQAPQPPRIAAVAPPPIKLAPKPPAAADAGKLPPNGSPRTDAPVKPERLPPVIVPIPEPVLVPVPVLPPTLTSPADLEFSVEEIRAAGQGVFGTVSSELASVIEHAFAELGRPNGYILGQEGGGAFIAGLRYGDGTVVTKSQGLAANEARIYWQGPSIGGDIGLTGSKVLMLIYNLDKPDDLMTRFVGVDGSAYLVGGVGMTFLKKGRVILAPIRSGLGLRLGANVGYLKFTPKLSLNPF